MRHDKKIGAVLSLCSLVLAQPGCSNESQVAPKKLASRSQEDPRNMIKEIYNIRESIEEIVQDSPQNSTVIVSTYPEYLGSRDIIRRIQIDASHNSGTNVSQIQFKIAQDIQELPKDKNLIIIGATYSNIFVDDFKLGLSAEDIYIPSFGIGRIIGARLKNGKVGILITGYNEIDSQRAANALSKYDQIVNSQHYDFNFSIIDVVGSTATEGSLVIIK